MRFFLIAFATFCLLAVGSSSSARKWSDDSGSFSLDGEFVRVEKDTVVLKRADNGTELKVPLTRLSAADQDYVQAFAIDPVDLLKKARPLYEQIPAEFRERGLFSLALVECLYGDRELGRKQLREVLDAAKNEKDLINRFALYGQVLQGQVLAGLPDDARETIRRAEADATQVPKDQWYGMEVELVFGKHALKFLASVKADDEALRLITDSRLAGGATKEIATLDDQQQKLWSTYTLVLSQLKRGDLETAKETFGKTLAEYPLAAADSATVPAMWYRLKEPARAKATLEAFVTEQKGKKEGGFEIARAYESMAEACIDGKDLKAAQDYYDESRKYVRDTGSSLMNFKARQGDFAAAAAVARKPADKDIPSGAIPPSTRARNLREIAIAAGRAGDRKLADSLLREADGLEGAEKPVKDPMATAMRKMDSALYALASGEIEALIKTADEAKVPMMQCAAYLLTAVEIYVRRTGKTENFLLPEADF